VVAQLLSGSLMAITTIPPRLHSSRDPEKCYSKRNNKDFFISSIDGHPARQGSLKDFDP
jgi:hypothetical protein